MLRFENYCWWHAVFLVVADESVGRGVPFVFLERVKEDFKKRYGASIASTEKEKDPLADDDEIDDLFEDRFSIAYNLDREFGFVSSLLFFFNFKILFLGVYCCDYFCLFHPSLGQYLRSTCNIA